MHSALRFAVTSTAVALTAIVAMPITTANAQTPIATPGAEVACTIEPRTIDEIEALVADVEPLDDFELPPFYADALPTGGVANAKTTSEIGTALETLVACYRESSYLAVLSLHTDRYIRDLASFETTLVEILTRPEVEDETSLDVFLADVRKVTVLDDGRVSAVVTIGGAEDPHPAPGRTLLMIFEEQDGVWLVDAQIEQLYRAEENETVYIAEAVGIEATPAATPGG